MKTQHSPTPWKWDEQYDSILSEAGIVCKIATGEDKREEDANARLIAAAPALLEACGIALEYFNSVPEREVAPSSEAFKAVESAISKATGDQS